MSGTMLNIGTADTDDIIRHCKRKKPYPTMAMALKDLESMKAAGEEKDGVLNAFMCRYGNHFHIGKIRKVSSGYKYFAEQDGVLFAKIKINNEHWVFMLPNGTPEDEDEVYYNGILIAHRQGYEPFRGQAGVKLRQGQFFNNMPNIFPKDVFLARGKIAEASVYSYPAALKMISERGYMASPPTPTPSPKRVIVRSEEKKQLEQQEMYQGRAVFRTPEGKPFHRDLITCCMDGCEAPIELRAYIALDKDGKLSSVYKRVPLDGKAVKRPGVAKQSLEWICKDCAKQHTPCTEQVEPPPALVAEPPPVRPVSLERQILVDLQRIAADETVDANFVRGATLMACHILNGGAL